MEKKLYRDEFRKKVGGVCAGVAEYLNMDVAIVRIAFFLAAVFHGAGIIVYAVLWIVLPKKDPFLHGPGVDYRVPPQNPFNPFKNTTPPNFTMPNYGDQARPFDGVPPVKKQANAGVVAGAVLIMLGMIFLVNEFNLIPDIDFDVVWPLVLVAVGIAFIFSGAKKQPWQKENWNEAQATEVKPADEQPAEEKKEENNNDNTQTI